jgi:hypothetical protein
MSLVLAARVAARYLRASSWEGKLVGSDFRLKWGHDTWLLEELPQKGKKKLRVDSMDGGGIRWSGTSHAVSAYIPENIMRSAKVTSSDSFDQVKTKIQAAMDAAAEEVTAKDPTGKWDFLKHTRWNEKLVYFTEVMPEGMEQFEANGKDFTISVSWTNFKAYNPGADFQQADPSYVMYDAKAPTSARKLYMMLKENPKLLEHVSWNDFGDWMSRNKINYDTNFSVYR